ncbi:MAG: prepilin-type N-terminal cleavage/methylation domain-containing protein [Clostridium sp.]|nr:prepilin-type N-terminal cleavage/methylation domain-containing protein [Clostridium sp.]
MKKSMTSKTEYMHNIKNENLNKGEGKRKKKGGFTLIEVIAVIAIIGVMASVLLPKFTNYINEAKKLKVVEQSRKVVMAVECYNMKVNKTSDVIKNDAKISSVTSKPEVSKYFENIENDIDKLDENMKISDCYNIVNGASFELDPEHDYKYKLVTQTSGVSTPS